MANENPYVIDNPYVISKNGNIPHPENFLQKAMSVSSDVGAVASGLAFPFPQAARQLSKVPWAGMTQFGAGEVGEPMFEIPEAQTETGKTLAGVAPYVPIGFGAIKGGIAAGKSGIKLASKLFGTRGLKASIKSAEEVVRGVGKEVAKIKNVGRLLSKRSAREAEQVSYVGKKAAQQSTNKLFKKANDTFGEGFSKLKSTMAEDDLAQVLTNAAKETGAEAVGGTPGNQFLELANRFGSKVTEGIIQGSPRIYSPQEVQAVTKAVLRSVKDERARAIFYKHLTDILPDTVPGLKELKAAHKPIYETAKKVAVITKSAIKRVATGKSSAAEVKTITRAEKELGTKFVEKAAGVAKKSKGQQTVLAKREASAVARKESAETGISKLEEKTAKVMRRRKVASVGAALTGVGLLGRLFGRGERAIELVE